MKRSYSRMDEHGHPLRCQKTRAWFIGIRCRRALLWYEQHNPGYLAVVYAEAHLRTAAHGAPP